MAMKGKRDIDLTPLLKKRFAPYPRTIGRFSVSDIWAICNTNRDGERYKGVEEWLHNPEPDLEGMMRMYNGIIQHEQVQFMLKKELCEVKVEYPYKGLTIVAKADYLPDDEEGGWEFKTSDKVLEKSKTWHDWQSKIYCTLYERPTWSILQPIVSEGKLVLREIGDVKRDDAWVHKQFDNLLDFHQEVLQVVDNPLDKEVV